MTDAATTIARIVRVNHAGEYGAIRIYGAQIAVSGWLWKALVAPLSELRRHEIDHCRKFAAAMPARSSRPCRTMWLWSWGGAALGALTAMMGPRAIRTCTEIVEDTVHHHLGDQLSFLDGKDPDLHQLIESIREEEEGHLTLARDNRGPVGLLYRALAAVIRPSVESVIWLSTWGDSARMRRDFAGGAT